MAPETRSHGKPPPERIYHSSPSLQQLQFPARRRRVVHTYGKGGSRSSHTSPREPTPSASGSASRKRDPTQKTLTQIDWVSSSAAPNIVLSDSEEEKENELPVDNDEDEDDEEPISSGKRKRRVRIAAPKTKGKRRRTLGDEAEDIGGRTKNKNDSRRKTMGDTPLSSKYHTQTLTQLVGREGIDLIKDSEDEDDGFDDWLAEPQSPSPKAKDRAGDDSPTKNTRIEEKKGEGTSRQSSVVPQTPAKRLRFEIPSSSQASTPISVRMLNRYGAPDKENPSPSAKGGSTQTMEPVTELAGKPKAATARKLVIEDSFATTDSLGSAGTTPIQATPLKDITADVVGLQRESSSATEMADTPTKSRRRNASAELGERTPTKKSPLRKRKTPSPKKVSIGGVFEIPDSDEDDGEFTEEEQEDDTADENTIIPGESEKTSQMTDQEASGKDMVINGDDGYVAGPETQVVMNELASSVDDSSAQATRPGSMGPPTSTFRQQPPASTPSIYGTPATHPVASQQLPPPAPTQTPAKPTPRPQPSKPLRKPIRHNPPSSQTQPLESQRVALDTIQSFGQPTNRTDIFLPTDSSTLANLTGGHALYMYLPFKVPTQVSRVWLFDGSLLRFAACIEPGNEEISSSGRSWSYHATQLYELNNPLDMDDMREEGWIEDEDLQKQYTYLPPVGVSQLLANLRHALFSDDPDYNNETQQEDTQEHAEEAEDPIQLPPANPGSSFSVSQAVEAQLRSDIATHTDQLSGDAEPIPNNDPDDAILVPSTPLKNRTPRSPIYPSQATTVSQTSTPEKQYQAPGTARRPPPLTPTAPAATPARTGPGSALPPQSSSSAFTFPDNDDSPPLLLQDSSAGGISLRSSQLLTKSQMLPDSLVRDDTRMPPQIWEFDEEG